MKKRVWLPRILSVVMVLLMVVAVMSIIFLPWIVTDYVDYAFAFTGITFVRQYYLAVLYASGILALASLFCFVLADVFEEAIHYKNENDLTI